MFLSGHPARRILVCDDDEPVRIFLTRVFERAGFTVDGAKDGAEALRLLDQRDYGLLILDLMMPRVNGYDLVAELSRREARPMVLVLTASRVIGKELDADVVQAIIRKPFDLPMLMLVVEGLAGAMLGVQRRDADGSRDELVC